MAPGVDFVDNSLNMEYMMARFPESDAKYKERIEDLTDDLIT
jgi:hypothetical protein